MSVPREKLREIVFQLLFAVDFSSSIEDETIAFFMKQLSVTKRIVRESIEKARAVYEKRDEIDAYLKRLSTQYTLERIQKVEMSILRQAAFDLIFDKEVPPKVVISEAIRLTRKFSTRDSAAFVNALLDLLYKEFLCEPVSGEVLDEGFRSVSVH